MLADEAVHDAWRFVLSQFSGNDLTFVSRAQPISFNGSLYYVNVRDDFTRRRLEQRHRTGIEACLQEFFKMPISLGIGIDPFLPEAEVVAEHDDPADFTPIDSSKPLRRIETKLNPKYTFETFVIGESNRFANVSAIAVAETPGAAFNPLLIYGDSGLGKTHLLHAIGHYVQQYSDDLRVKYVSTEEMMNEFINSIQENKMVDFRRRYREEVDLLLIDDIQFIERREQTQEEFFHIFNALYESNKQIVITCDRPPKNLTELEPRLRSRFASGLLVDVQPPSLETRIAILRKKVEQERLIAKDDVLQFIASRVSSNIRELEAALIRVTAYASLQHQEITLSLAEQVLHDLLPTDLQSLITPEIILAEVSAYYDVSIDLLRSPERTASIAMARQVAMYLCRALTDLSLPVIGTAFNRDHSTVLHGFNKVEKLLSERIEVYEQVTELTGRIRSAAR
ncbi:MAG: chromosomal replication initiator protein DnaA [Propionibacteriaceae bacterium]|nr:chromosomal replication initiator protein DnaA [Propionibacteriaceae bacterium]